MELDPYALISEFWGDELSPELASRMIDAPGRHLDQFEQFLFDHPPGMDKPPDLIPGYLRPVLMSNIEDQVRNRSHALDLVELAPGLLLYAHEVVLDDVLFFMTSSDRHERERAVSWLLQVHPLHRQRCIFFRPLSSSKRHPAYRAAFGVMESDADREALLTTGAAKTYVDQLSRRLGEQSGLAEAEARSVVIEELIYDATIQIRHSEKWGGRTHRLFRSQAEIDVLNAYLRQPIPLDARDANLTALANLVVPSFAQNVSTLVSVRSQSEAFSAWRSQLALALDRLTLVGTHDENSIEQARLRLREELLPLTENLARETRKSAALSALKDGAKNFGVALVSGIAGYSVGGSITTALTSAVAGKTLDTIHSYRTSRKQQRQRVQLAELALMLTNPTAIREV